MTHRNFLLLSLLLLSLSAPSFASGVLLPSNNKSTQPNLGLVPREAQAPATEKAEPILNTDSATTPPAVPTVTAPTSKELEGMIQEQGLQKAGTLAITPGGTVANDSNNAMNAAIAKMIASGQYPAKQKYDPAMAEFLKKKAEIDKARERDPLILDEYAFPALDSSGMNGSVDVGVAPTYKWGQGDIRVIERALGYSAYEIPKNCQLRMDAMAETEVAAYLYKGIALAGTKATIKYAGKLSGVSLQPQALCRKPNGPLPRNGSIIMRSGNNYGILLLGRKTCKITDNSRSPNSLLVQFNGDDKITCTFN